MLGRLCSVGLEDVATVRSSKLLAKLEFEDLNLILRGRGLGWFGHVECSVGAVRAACDVQINGGRGARAGMVGTGGEGLPWVEDHDS